MKKILNSNLNHARNAEHFQFHADVLSVLTAEVAQAQNIDNNLLCPLAAKKAAAQKLAYPLNPYRSANSRPYAENTAQITNFVSDMQSAEYTPHMATLGLTEAIAQLKTANDDFNAAYAGRSGEKLTRISADNMKAIRPKVDDAYRVVVSVINALYLVNESVTRTPATSASLGKLIDGINALIIQLQQTLSHRSAGTKPQTPGGTPEDPDSGKESVRPEEI